MGRDAPPTSVSIILYLDLSKITLGGLNHVELPAMLCSWRLLFFHCGDGERRAKILGNDLARDLLRAAFQDCFQRWPPFRVDAMVMLHDHMHAIW
ncbi:MAG: hypothetical protein ACXV8Q_16605, partial [Methylobacter sp.]